MDEKGNVHDLKTYMARGNGETVLEDVVENLYLAVQQGMVKDIVFVAVNSDGEVVHGLNTMDAFRAIGLLDTGKLLIQNAIYEPDDY